MIYIIILALIFAIWILYENEFPVLTKYGVESGNTRLKILHISDLHNYKFGQNQQRLVKLIESNYDFIFLTGDLIDRRYKGSENVKSLIEFLNKKYQEKIYFSMGNHEKGSKDYQKFKKYLIKSGVNILDNSAVDLGEIRIIGISDPSEYISLDKKKPIDERKIVSENLSSLIKKDKFNLVLAHRPEMFDLYVKFGANIVFSGHSHGGQIKIFNRGLYAPGQGFFAKYAGGIFKVDKTIMINSRGLGSNFPFVKRIFNRPEIIEINIRKS